MGIELSKKNNKINLSGELLRGEPGGYYIPTVDLDGNITWEATDEKMPDVEAANIKGRDAIIGATPVFRVNGEEDFYALIERLTVSRANIEHFDIINDGEAFYIHIYQNTFTVATGDIYTISITNTGVIRSAVYMGSFVLEADGYLFKMWDDWEEQEKLIPVLNGKQGKDGINGKDGVSGKDGINGRDGANGVSVSKVEVDADNHLQITLSNGTIQDAGQISVSGGGSGSAEYELIRSFTVTDADVANEVKGFAFGADDNGNEFSLSHIVAYCYFPGASGAGTFEIAIKNASGALKGIYKRSEVLATAARWVKVDMELKGYWTGGCVTNTGANSTAAIYEGHARNNVSNKAYYINLVSNVVLPVGSTIEVFGVRA